MLSEQQQRIMGYFIEEAKDHLSTIEQALLNLKPTLEDSEMANEVFRAAHSVKGGAAMLGLTSIQHTAHRLEDYFKVLKECALQVDQKLETMLLRVYDTLQELVEQLQGPFGLTDDKAEEAMTAVEPVFVALNQHLEQLVSQSGMQPPEDVSFVTAPAATAAAPAVRAQPVPAVSEESALRFVFQNDVPARLREMLQLFKQPDSDASRQQLQVICQTLAQAGEQFDLPEWCDLVGSAEQVILNADNTYRTLAPIVIKDIKHAQEQILAGNSLDVSASDDLLDLLPPELDSFADDGVSDADLANLLGADVGLDDGDFDLFGVDSGSSDLSELSDNPDDAPALSPELSAALSAPPTGNSDFDDFFGSSQPAMDVASDLELGELDAFEAAFGTSETLNAPELGLGSLQVGPEMGPEVGSSELNSLADLFEGEDSGLELNWQEEVMDGINGAEPELELETANDFNDDFSDLLSESSGSAESQSDAIALETSSTGELESDWSDLLSSSAAPAPASEFDFSEFDASFNSDAPTGLPAEDLSDPPPEAEPLADLAAAENLFALEDFDLTDDELAISLEPEAELSLDIEPTSEIKLDITQSGTDSLQNLDDLFSISEEIPENAFVLDDDPADLMNPTDTADTADVDQANSTDLADPFGELSLETDLSFDSLPGSELFDSSPPTETALESPFELGADELDLDDPGADDLSIDLFDQSPTAAPDLESLDNLDSLESPDLESPDLEFDAFASNADLELGDLNLADFADPVAELAFETTETTETAAEITSEAASAAGLEDLAQDDVFELDFDSDVDSDADSEPDSATELDNPFALDLGAVDLHLEAELPGLEAIDLESPELTEFELPDAESLALENLSSDPGIDLEAIGLEALEPESETDNPFAALEATAEEDSAWFEESGLEALPASPAEDPSEMLIDTASADELPEADGLDALDLSTDDLEFDPETAVESSKDGDELDFFNLSSEGAAAEDEELSGLESLNLSESDDGFSFDFDAEPVEPESALDFSSLKIDAPTENIESPDDLAPDEPLNFDSAESASSELKDLDFSEFDFGEDSSGTASTEAEVDGLDDSGLDDSGLDDLTPELFGTDFELGASADEAANLGLLDAEADRSISEPVLDFGELDDAENLDLDLDLDPLTLDQAVEPTGSLDEAADDGTFDLLGTSIAAGLSATGLSATGLGAAGLALSGESAPDEAALDESTPESDDALNFDDDFGLGDDFSLVETTDTDIDLDAGLDLAFEDSNSEQSLELSNDLFADAPTEQSDQLADQISLDGFFDSDASSADSSSADLPNLIDFPDSTAALGDLDLGDLDLGDLDLGHSDGHSSDDAESMDSASIDSVAADFDLMLADGNSNQAIAEPAEFDDLAAMLAEDSSPITAIHESEENITENSFAGDSFAEDFSDLEALIGDAPELPAATQPARLKQPAQPVQPAEAAPDDEFGDLEAMLQDADQALGGSNSPARKSQSNTNRRPNRRGGINEQNMRVSVKHLDNLNNLVGEMVVNRNTLEQAEERLRQFLDNLLYQVQQLSDVGQRMRDLYERSLLESSLLSGRRGMPMLPVSGFGSSQPNHVTGASFDALEMDRFTGFHTLSQEMIELIVRVRESASDIDFVVEETDQVTRNFRQITTQLQEGLTRSRMVPFAQTADRLTRGVRDNSLKYGKQAELLIEGRDTLIDKMIVELLYDPMTHLVNNAVAHGIETPEERIAAGKPPTGRITIRAFHQGNQTVISVGDDGAGINPEAVRAKALAKKLITATQARDMTRLDTYDLLFHHGFSTADQVDDLRGRGVGLDVVRNNLNEIRGTINIDSTIGKGTTFTIRLPLTLSISKALCCISNRARIAFPMDGVEDMIDVPRERVIIDDQERPCIQWRDELLPFQTLSDLLRYNRVLGRGSVYGGNQEEDMISLVILRSSSNFLALQVDQVLGEQEIVIKQLEGPVPKPLGVAGATVLGDGRIMPIADVLELIDLWEGRIRRESGTTSLWDMGEAIQPPEQIQKTEPTVLIVDDSITVRELLSMTFNKVGYRVEQARDGQEAWEKLRSGLPCDLVFCDIEMPRMDGLELLSRIQKDPNLSHLPIAMLTSRGADRHRQMAVQLGAKGYFTKPYLEEVLLDAANRMLKGEVMINSVNTQ
ncbi:MAG: response regulator [Pegethrix bostrychoides GSE-TBD4-15B]|uniref:histidine kinase n=1 Tax=Pegethrix bostrychoides GSE-TBD4-15B TaxID=2839662 RepID=A0A951U6B6_9CYAN|nr:response regulator [Pegethrix bostrychoides GSE-TBD4-15B]